MKFFEMLSNAQNIIILQIETTLFEGDEFKKFCNEHFEECVVSLASAVNDPVCWKTLNTDLLNRTKSDSTQVLLFCTYNGVIVIVYMLRSF